MRSILGVLYATLDHLLEPRVEYVCLQLTGAVQIWLDHGAPHGLTDVLIQENRILGNHRGFSERFQNGNGVPN